MKRPKAVRRPKILLRPDSPTRLHGGRDRRRGGGPSRFTQLPSCTSPDDPRHRTREVAQLRATAGVESGGDRPCGHANWVSNLHHPRAAWRFDGCGPRLKRRRDQSSRARRQILSPLAPQPILAAALVVCACQLLRSRCSQPDCVWLMEPESPPGLAADGQGSLELPASPQLVIARERECDDIARPPVRLPLSRLKDGIHILSAVSICFARAVNDTPKLAALLLGAHLLGIEISVGLVAAAMGVGGILLAPPRRGNDEPSPQQHGSRPRPFGQSHYRSHWFCWPASTACRFRQPTCP